MWLSEQSRSTSSGPISFSINDTTGAIILYVDEDSRGGIDSWMGPLHTSHRPREIGAKNANRFNLLPRKSVRHSWATATGTTTAAGAAICIM